MSYTEQLEQCILDFVRVTSFLDPTNDELKEARNKAAQLVPSLKGNGERWVQEWHRANINGVTLYKPKT